MTASCINTMRYGASVRYSLLRSSTQDSGECVLHFLITVQLLLQSGNDSKQTEDYLSILKFINFEIKIDLDGIEKNY